MVKQRALVIDDSKPVRSILTRMLRNLDFETAEAANGREGLALLQEWGKPDLATVNWQMPELDGLQFIRAVRADARYRDLPILMISSESEPSRVATALSAGANDYIIKPCTQKSLTEKLRRLGIPIGENIVTTVISPASHTRNEDQKIRVLVVDDSVVVRRVVSSVLADDPQLEVVGAAVDGQMALEMLDPLSPDVVLLDVEMPKLNGLETLKVLRRTHPKMIVIMFSSLTERGASVTTDALLTGANDYVAKPGGTHMTDPEAGRRTIREELIPKIKQLSLKQDQVRWVGTSRNSNRPTRHIHAARGGRRDGVLDWRTVRSGSIVAAVCRRLSGADLDRAAHAAGVYKTPGPSLGGRRQD